jgi:iron complex transport system ATP-binding protein
MGMLRRQAIGGMAVVVVLHDLALAARFCDRLALLGEGGLLASGVPPDVLSDALLARAFAIRALRGTQDGEAWVLPWREVGP